MVGPEIMHTSHTKWTQQVVFLYLCVYVYIKIIKQKETMNLKGSEGRETGGARRKGHGRGWREEEERGNDAIIF